MQIKYIDEIYPKLVSGNLDGVYVVHTIAPDIDGDYLLLECDTIAGVSLIDEIPASLITIIDNVNIASGTK